MSESNQFNRGSDMPRPKRPIPPASPKQPHTPATPARPAAARPAVPQSSVAPRTPVSPKPQTPSHMPETVDDGAETRLLPRQAAVSDTQPLPPPVSVPYQPAPAQRSAGQPVQRPGKRVPKSSNAQSPQRKVRPARPSAPQKAPAPYVDPYQQAAPPPRKHRHRKMGCLPKIVLGMLVAFAICFGIYSFIALKCIGKLEQVEVGDRTVSSAGCLSSDNVRNILLIGSDSRDDQRGRSDTMMLVSLNKKTNEISLTSFLRDSYVSIPGHGENRLNAAYSFGGATLLLDTIQQNFQIVVDDYLEVNFQSFASIIDAVGGVEITVTDKEAEAINNILRDEVNGLMGDAVDADFLSGAGTFQLNGKQALSFSRIRKVGNADFQRTERQREVITQMLSSLKHSGVKGLSGIMSNALPHLSTNMSTSAMYLLSLRAPFLLSYDLNQLQIPADDTLKGETINGASVLTFDKAANHKLLAEKIYGKK